MTPRQRFDLIAAAVLVLVAACCGSWWRLVALLADRR